MTDDPLLADLQRRLSQPQPGNRIDVFLWAMKLKEDHSDARYVDELKEVVMREAVAAGVACIDRGRSINGYGASPFVSDVAELHA
jgi:hypothetical protein